MAADALAQDCLAIDPDVSQPPAAGSSERRDLTSYGAVGGIGVETAPKVYLIFWGSQWTNNDPPGEATIVQKFLKGVGGGSWNNSVTQYCQNLPSGTVFCSDISVSQAR